VRFVGEQLPSSQRDKAPAMDACELDKVRLRDILPAAARNRKMPASPARRWSLRTCTGVQNCFVAIHGEQGQDRRRDVKNAHMW